MGQNHVWSTNSRQRVDWFQYLILVEPIRTSLSSDITHQGALLSHMLFSAPLVQVLSNDTTETENCFPSEPE